jgi:hypothetical protein
VGERGLDIRGLRERGVGAVDLAVAVDVLRGEVPGLAEGVVGDAEGECAGLADGGDDAWVLRFRRLADVLAAIAYAAVQASRRAVRDG